MTKPSQKIYSVAVAGSTIYTVWLAQSLIDHPNFKISVVITPLPKIINGATEPMQTMAKNHNIPLVQFTQLNQQAKTEITNTIPKKVDFLLVADFGYLIPPWMLNLATIAPINVHPSLLPRWRGSSPGQFAILFGDKNSAVSIMKMSSEFDQGPTLVQEKFEVNPDWTAHDYYNFSFRLASKILPSTLLNLAQGQLKPSTQANQPSQLARRLSKQDGFVPWEVISQNSSVDLVSRGLVSSLLAKSTKNQWPQILKRASLALYPWPNLWTIIPTKKGNLRMKIFDLDILGSGINTKIVLKKVQVEGKQPSTWNQIKNILS